MVDGNYEQRRWDTAVDIAQGRANVQTRWARKRVGLWSVFLLFVGGLAGYGLYRLLQATTSAKRLPDPPLWFQIVLTTIIIAAFVVIIVSFFRSVKSRKGLFGLFRLSPLVPLTRRQRGDALREIKGRRPVIAAHLPVTVPAARMLAEQRKLLPMQMTFVVILYCAAAQSTRISLIVFMLVSVTFSAVVNVTTFRDSRRAERFVAMYGDQVPIED